MKTGIILISFMISTWMISPQDSVKVEILPGRFMLVATTDTAAVNTLPPECIDRKLLYIQYKKNH